MPLNGRPAAPRSLRFAPLPLLFLVVGAAAALASGCGARSPLDVPPLPPPGPECTVDADCVGFGDYCNPVVCRASAASEGQGGEAGGGRCVTLEPIDCDDLDPCTDDACDPLSGACSYELATHDVDEDGFRGPLAGKKAGEPGSCGADCDDTSPLAYPGAIEVCDGVDNDCNGIVDDDADFVPLDDEPIRISGDIAPAGPGGLAWSGSSFASVYSGTNPTMDVYRTSLTENGEPIAPGETLLTPTNGDASGGPIVWTGDRFGVAWQDRRDGDYEVYFALLDPAGNKIAPGDVRVTTAMGFSVGVSLAYDGQDFVAVWQDDRDNGLIHNIYAQKLSLDGVALPGGNIALTKNEAVANEAPSVATGGGGIGVAWARGDSMQAQILFQTFAAGFVPLTEPVVLSDGSTRAAFPTVVWNEDRYVVAWFDKDLAPTGIYAAALSDHGAILVPPKPISEPGAFRSRYPFLRPLGDRLLALYADDRDQNDGYEIYSRMVSSDLVPLGAERRLTFAEKDSINPIAAFGPEGILGVLFRDDRQGGAHHVWFLRLGCVVGGGP